MYTAKAQGKYWTVFVYDMNDSPVDASRLACEAVRFFDEVHPKGRKMDYGQLREIKDRLKHTGPRERLSLLNLYQVFLGPEAKNRTSHLYHVLEDIVDTALERYEEDM